MDQRPVIPERVSSLMSPRRQANLSQYEKRSVSAASKCSQLSTKSDVSEFFEAKLAHMQSKLDLLKCYKAGLDEVRAENRLTDARFVQELEPYLADFRDTSRELKVLKRQRREIVADMDEEVRTKVQRLEGPDKAFIENAYKNSTVSRVMTSSGKQRALNFDQSAFRKNVAKYYGAEDPEGDYLWCHILHMWLPSKQVKAAHLVPKTLSEEELGDLFGVDRVMLSDARNGITLAANVEDRLDKGHIVIVPVPGEPEMETHWRCVLLDDTKRKETVWVGPPAADRVFVRLEDIDGKELQFLTDNRPARRYLYFRFIISYLSAKRAQVANLNSKVDKTRFWPTIGRYLHKSTLVTLARCVSGCELPEDLVKDKTFELDDHSDKAKGEEAGMAIGADLLDTFMGRMDELEMEDEEETDESE